MASVTQLGLYGGSRAVIIAASSSGTVGFSDSRISSLPIIGGPEWVAFIAAAGGTVIGSSATDARNALAAAIGGITEAQALNISLQDMWKRYILAGSPLV